MNVLLYEPYNINGSDYNKNARRSPQEAMAENQGCHHKWKEFKLLHILPGQITHTKRWVCIIYTYYRDKFSNLAQWGTLLIIIMGFFP